MTNPTLKIMLVEDEVMWQEGIRALLSTRDNWHLVAIADEYEHALSAFSESNPDVVLLDWKIKGEQDGLAVGAALTDRGFPPERVILVSGSDPSLIPDNPYSYVPKHLIGNQLTDMIQRVTQS